jgi:sulfur relay protein TusB/DsrH
MNTGLSSAQQGSLHLLFSHDTDTVRACASHCRPGDGVVLVNTAVLLVLDKDWNLFLEAGVSIHALQPDVQAQGMTDVMCRSGCKMISDEDWVGLVMRYPHCLSWK